MIPVRRQPSPLRSNGACTPDGGVSGVLRAHGLRRRLGAVAFAVWLLACTAPHAEAATSLSQGCNSLRGLESEGRSTIDRGKTFVALEAREGERIKRGLAVRRVAAPLAAVRDVVLDHERLPELSQALKSARITGEDGSATLVRQVLDLPFPLRNRRYTLRLEASEHEDCFESSWTYVAGSGNIADTFGRWEILRLEPGVVLLAYVATADPGGWIPAFAANWAARRALPEVIGNVAAAAEAAETP